MTKAFYRNCLEAELARRKTQNPRYSLRAYARALAVDPAQLSRILSEAAEPSPRVLEILADGLALDAEARRLFLASGAEEHLKAGRRRAAGRRAGEPRGTEATKDEPDTITEID